MAQLLAQKKNVSVIIPAFNEGRTIGSVVEAVIHHPWVKEVIVVDDGSSDLTVINALRCGARVISHVRNMGKAMAMETGVAHASGKYLCFVDSDLVGFDAQKLERILRPVVEGEYDLYVGIRERKTYWLNKFLRFFPIIGGERALTRDVWLSIPTKYKQKFQIEIAMNYFCKQSGKRMGHEVISGVRHITKERKMGLLRGTVARIRMTEDLLSIGLKLYVGESMKRELVSPRILRR